MWNSLNHLTDLTLVLPPVPCTPAVFAACGTVVSAASRQWSSPGHKVMAAVCSLGLSVSLSPSLFPELKSRAATPAKIPLRSGIAGLGHLHAAQQRK